MGQKESSNFGPLGFDPSKYKQVVMVRRVKGSGRSWLCERLRDHGCACLDLNQLVRDNFNTALSPKENRKNLEHKFKEISNATSSKLLILFSDYLITSPKALAKFFIELDGWSLEKGFRRGHMMNVNRIQSHASKLKDAIRNGPLADIDKAFVHAGFDCKPTLQFTEYMVEYNRAKESSTEKGYTVIPCQAVRNEIEKMCGALTVEESFTS